MLTSSNLTKRTKRPFDDRLGEIRRNIASSMIGKSVSLMADARTVACGLVAGVIMEAGTPKVVVNGHSYDVGSVLTVTTGLN